MFSTSGSTHDLVPAVGTVPRPGVPAERAEVIIALTWAFLMERAKGIEPS